jgi:hypothetical protein
LKTYLLNHALRLSISKSNRNILQNQIINKRKRERRCEERVPGSLGFQ